MSDTNEITIPKRILTWIKANRVILLFFTIYLVTTFVAILFHENWEDEAQAWLTARDCSPLELIGRMKYEGHFLPWYFVIMPFAKFGLPFKTVNIISWIISAISAWLMLKYLPCKKYKRIIFVFTVPMIYLYPVIARCYSLIPLAVILLIIFYKDRFKRPLRYLLTIVLLANTHIYCFGFALIIGAEFLIDWLNTYKKNRRKQNHKILVYVISIVIFTILTYLPLLGSVNGVSNIEFNPSSFNLKYLLLGIPSQFITSFSMLMPTVLIWILLAFAFSYTVLYRWDAFIRIFPAIIWQFLVCYFVYPFLSLQKIFICVFIFLFFLVRGPYPARRTTPSLEAKIAIAVLLITLVILSGNTFCEIVCFVFLVSALIPCLQKSNLNKLCQGYKKILAHIFLMLAAVAVINGIFNVYYDIRYIYSKSLAVAKYIEENIPNYDTEAIFLVDVEPVILYTPITAYLNNPNFKIYDVNSEEFFTYAIEPAAKEDDDDTLIKDMPSYCTIRSEARCFYVAIYVDVEKAISGLKENEEEALLFKKWSSYDNINEVELGVNEDDWGNLTYERFRLFEITPEDTLSSARKGDRDEQDQ